MKKKENNIDRQLKLIILGLSSVFAEHHGQLLLACLPRKLTAQALFVAPVCSTPAGHCTPEIPVKKQTTVRHRHL